MTRHVNLMSRHARIRTELRRRTRQWACIIVTVALLLSPTLFVGWWSVHQNGQNLLTLEAEYDPIRQLKSAIKSYEQQIDRIRSEEATALKLASLDTPVITLFGIVGGAFSESQGAVYLEHVEFRQNTLFSTQPDKFLTTMTLEGRGVDDNAVHYLATKLQSVLPFASVQLSSLAPQPINQQPAQAFRIDCSF